VNLPPLRLSIPREYDRRLDIGTWALEVVVCPEGLYPVRFTTGCIAGLRPRGGLGILRELYVYRQFVGICGEDPIWRDGRCKSIGPAFGEVGM
jgi:hypothetical protein